MKKTENGVLIFTADLKF